MTNKSKVRSLPLRNDGVDFNFEQDVISDQAPNLHHCRSREDFREGFLVCSADVLPLRDIRYKDSGTHNISQLSVTFVKGSLDILEDLHCLCVGVSDTHDRTAVVRRRRAGNKNVVSNAHRSGIPYDRLPWRIRRDILAIHSDC